MSSKKLTKISIILLLLFFVFSTVVQAGLDQSIREAVMETNEGKLSDFMSFISSTGDAENAYKGLALMPNGKVRSDLIFALGASQLITESIKFTVGRTRPRTGKDELRFFSGHKSFPSGHATGSFATATVLAHHYPELGKFAYTWASLVAISRMYEDAHWFSDVVVGSAIGYFTARQTLGLRLTWSW